jgi:hypothetical protein
VFNEHFQRSGRVVKGINLEASKVENNPNLLSGYTDMMMMIMMMMIIIECRKKLGNVDPIYKFEFGLLTFKGTSLSL